MASSRSVGDPSMTAKETSLGSIKTKESRDDSEWLPTVIGIGTDGMKGYLELGALKYLYKIGLLKRVNKIIGCSIGSIIGLLYTIGYSFDEIITHSVELSILDHNSILSISDIYQQMAIMSNSHIKSDLEKLIKIKLGRVPSMKELYLSTGIEFTAVTYNMDVEDPIYLNYKTDPSLSCLDTVMLSCNIPGVFPRIKYRGSYCIDGYFGNPYPIDYYDDGKTYILGIYINTDSSAFGDPESYKWYASKIFYANMIQHRKKIIKHASDKCKHLKLTADIGINLAIDNKCRGKMMAQGWELAKSFYISLISKEVDLPNFEYTEPDDGEIPVVTNYTESHLLPVRGNYGETSTYDIPPENQEILNDMRQYRRTGHVRPSHPKVHQTLVKVPVPLPLAIPDGIDPEDVIGLIENSKEYKSLIKQCLKSLSLDIKEVNK